MDRKTRRTWAEISLKNLEHNYHTLRAMLPQGCKLLAPVKADAYGHGAVPVARKLEELGIDYLAVACPDEGEELRRAGIKAPILILGYTDPCWAEELIKNELTQGVFNEETAVALSQAAVRAGKPLKVHLKADTGMTRLGLLCDAASLSTTVEAAARMHTLPGLEWEGIFTHFSHADGSEEYTMLQFTRFLDLLKALEERGIMFPIRHCAASAATLNYPCTYLDMVRPGIAFYGHYPDPACEGLDGPGLAPLMTLKTRVLSVKDVPAGTAVSYGRTHTLDHDARLAVLGIGYADGLSRKCSDRLSVWLRGRLAPLVGRVCMDLCMVDVTGVPGVTPGDEVEVYGPHAPVEAAAELAGTIQYELLCNVSKRVPRLYIEG